MMIIPKPFSNLLHAVLQLLLVLAMASEFSMLYRAVCCIAVIAVAIDINSALAIADQNDFLVEPRKSNSS